MRAFLLLLLIFPSMLFSDPYQKAHEAYKLGEKAESIDAREAYFNEALALYSKQEVPSGKLYYNIGNCYYQLGELGLAIWYYQKALKFLPREAKILSNLVKAQQEAQVSKSPWDAIQKQIFFWNSYLSDTEKHYALMGLLVLTFLMFSAYLWLRRGPLKYIALGLVVFSAFAGYKELPWVQQVKKGLFVQPALLRCAPGNEYKTVDQTLSSAGQEFTVLEVSEDKEWVKVKTHPNKVGYVHHSLVRLF